MKKVTYLTCIISVAIVLIGSTIAEEKKYIYLNAEQLKPLGIELSEKGLFYQNCNHERERNPYLAFYAIDKNYLTSSSSDDCTSVDKKDNIFKNKKITEYDFYPIMVGNPQNEYSFATVIHDKELVPIAVCMSETKIKGRTDTLIFWFKPTESFQKALPDGIKMEDYLRLPDKSDAEK